MVKDGSALYIVPEYIALKPRRGRYMSFWSSNCQHKLQWARFGWEMAAPNLGIFKNQVLLNRFVPDLFKLARTLSNF